MIPVPAFLRPALAVGQRRNSADERQLCVDYDIIVCGGGTAGAAAAIKAGSMGARVLVVEGMSGLGGTQSFGWVTPMMPNYLDGTQLARGMNLEIQDEHARLSPPTQFPNAQVWYNPVNLALALDRLADRAGVERLYNAHLVACELKGDRIAKIQVAVKAIDDNLLTLEAQQFIDATGDADLARMSGCPTESGDDNGINQPMTLRFAVGSVDLQRVGDFFQGSAHPNEPGFLSVGFAEAKDSPIAASVREAIAEGILSDDDIGYFQFFTMLGRPRELAFNCPRLVGYQPLDPFSHSRALAAGREKVFRIHDFCRKRLPGFEDSYVSVVAPLMGVRESRRIVGRYVLTEEDHRDCRKFPDAIARNRYPIDIHLPDGGVELRKLPSDDYHEIPFRCLLPQGISNLLVAGRCLSATFAAQSSVRIQPVCRAMGEAAGAAAALCVRNGTDPAALPYGMLRDHLDLSVG
jgi:hypothetical protein